MDDPGWSWPAWKFGMKRDALFTTLQDQYNTFQSTIQDPQAFHHDVFEIAQQAATTGEFHRLLASRRDQRLHELNDSLESASCEIIANPTLVGTAQWEIALQLFRTRSLDSLVRYFASYLPVEHPWHGPDTVVANQTLRESTPLETRTEISATRATKPLFNDAVLTNEPDVFTSRSSLPHVPHYNLPPSPSSSAAYSDVDDVDLSHQRYVLNTLTPARTLSTDSEDNQHPPQNVHLQRRLQEEECEQKHDEEDLEDDCPSQLDDDTYQSSGPDTPASMSDTEVDVADVHVHDTDVDNVTLHSATVKPITPASTESPVNDKITSTTPNSKAFLSLTRNANYIGSNPDSDTAFYMAPSPSHKSPSLTRCRPLHSGHIVDASSGPSPLPISMHIRQRSMSPSRPWPLVQTATVRHPSCTDEDRESTYCHTATPHRFRPAGCYSQSRESDEQSVRDRCHSTRSSHIIQQTRSSGQNHTHRGAGRRRSRPGIEKTPLLRLIRTRLHERRDAAISAVMDEQQKL